MHESNILNAIKQGVSTRGQLASFSQHHCFISMVEPQKVYEAGSVLSVHSARVLPEGNIYQKHTGTRNARLQHGSSPDAGIEGAGMPFRMYAELTTQT